MADIDLMNLAELARRMKKKDGSTVSQVWVYKLTSGAVRATDYWLKQISAVTDISIDKLKAQIRRNKERAQAQAKSYRSRRGSPAASPQAARLAHRVGHLPARNVPNGNSTIK